MTLQYKTPALGLAKIVEEQHQALFCFFAPLLHRVCNESSVALYVPPVAVLCTFGFRACMALHMHCTTDF